jgi:hypothetical protein
MKSTDTANQIRGIGTYLINQSITGSGIRPAPYSRSFSINNFTYGATNNASISQPHGIGFVWASMLWDMTWDMIDVYGFSPNIFNGNGGNNKALQLVVDGLKLQPCNPGFVDGRNAIIDADLIANNGVNRCLIWNAFAKRGLGVGASQGSASNRSDQVEAFDVPADCSLSINGFNNENIYLFPNPTEGELQIASKNTLENCVISIYDINGRLVFNKNQSLDNISVLNIENLVGGVYFIKIINENINFQSKIVKK